MIRDIRFPLISKRMPSALALSILAFILLSSSILPSRSILASTHDSSDVAVQASAEGILTVRSADFRTKDEFGGMNITILSGEQVIKSDVTPATFALNVGQKYTVIGSNENSTFFSRWSDTIVEGIAREVTVGTSGLNLTALYRVIPDAKEVSVSVIAHLSGEDDILYPLKVVESTMQYAKSNKHSTLDSGPAPKIYRLAEGMAYRVIATISEDPAARNFKFDHWIDPDTNKTVSSLSLVFKARDGLVLDAVYRQDDSSTVVIPVTSKLQNGTVIEGIYNKAVDLSKPQSAPADEGLTPVEYLLERGGDFAAVASEVCGFCLTKTIVFDHWEAAGGPLIDEIVYSDEYEFTTGDVASRIDSLAAVYRIVPDDDFWLTPVNTTGTDVTVEIPPHVNGGITLEFGEVVDNGNVTAAENGVAIDSNLFDNVDVSRGNATMNAAAGPGNLTVITFETYGPVVRINDGNLTLAGTTNVTVHYDLAKIPVGLEPAMLNVLHFNGVKWENVTLTRNDVNRTVTGAVKSLSPILIAWDSKFGIGGVKQPGPATESKRSGGGGGKPMEIVPALYLERGVDVTTSLAIGPSKNETVEFALEEVTTPGKVTVAPASSPELAPLFLDGPERTVMILGSNFTALGAIYKVTPDAQLAFSGTAEISIPYNETSIMAASSPNVTEADVRLIYYNGSAWEDSTVFANATTDRVTGQLGSISSQAFMAVAIVHDMTYGQPYFEMNPHSKVSIDSIALAADAGDEIAGCPENDSDRNECEVVLKGSIRNVQRTNQSYAIIVQTTDERGVVQAIELVMGSLGKAETFDLDLTWNVESEGPSRHRVQVLVLNSILEDSNIIADTLALDLEL